MDGVSKADIKEPLLPKDRTGSEEDPGDFKSWNSADEEDKHSDHGPANSFTSKDVAGVLDKDENVPKNEETKEAKEERKSEFSKQGSKELSGVNSASENATIPRKSMNIGAFTPKKKKKSVWSEIFDFLLFWYEFILVMCIIGTGSILPAVPPSIYVFWSVLYLGVNIIIEKKSTTITICTILMGIVLTASVVFLIIKIVFTVLFRTDSLTYNKRVHLSFGMAVTNNDIDAWLIIKTFLWDVVALLVSLLLFINWIVKAKRKDDELGVNKIESLKVTGARSPSFWIGVCILFITLAGIIAPSIISFSFVSK
jgi:hypothetical protein